MTKRINWRHQYDPDRDAKEGDAAALRCEDESLTVQSFTEDADINVLARRFGLTDIPNGPLDPAFFRDTTTDPELREILDAQREAKDRFLALPAKLRKRFHNSPKELWDFVNDPENSEEAIRLGLLQQRSADTANTSTTAPGSHSNTTSTTATNAGDTSTAASAPSRSTEGVPKPPHTP